jgi:murein tripeptide amidase MpaA
VARLEPYGLDRLERRLAEWRAHPAVAVTSIGRSHEGRELPLLRVGNPQTPMRILIRARAHPWETGGSWVIEGLMEALLSAQAVHARRLEHLAFDVLPMANPDGVAAGRSRFNAAGMDLNRGWLESADARLAPENAALERWVTARQAEGTRFGFFLDLHNDHYGKIHAGLPAGDPEAFDRLVRRYEALLKAHTWFTEGLVNKAAGNPGTSADGMAVRFGVPGVVQELNAD